MLPPNSLTKCCDLRRTKGPTEIECYDSDRMSAVGDYEHTRVEWIERTSGGPGTIRVTPEFDRSWRRDVSTSYASPKDRLSLATRATKDHDESYQYEVSHMT
jgi:hypothetical protein